MKKKNRECVAMILAGGQGSRLGILTENLAKPAVPFGGKYRIIDFTLSNCANSGMHTVGVLTQYQPLILNSHIGTGRPWDLDRGGEGVTMLSPYVDVKGGAWYKGTANAIYQNIFYIDQMNPEYVLILSGDHIYKMNYSDMLDYHKQQDADATISVIEVPSEEASRFGIMNTNEDGSIYEFEEKPENPKSNLASMGIYIFKWKELRKYLVEDEQMENSSNDFGKDIIPAMLKDGKKMYSYRFEGYWKDVGTIESLWQANMDLLSETPELDLYDDAWKIYTENTNHPPHYACKNADIVRTLVNEGCEVCGEIEHSILFQGVKVGENVKIKDSLIFPNVTIEDGAVIEKAIIGENSYIKSGAVIKSGTESNLGDNYGISESGIIVIGEDSVI